MSEGKYKPHPHKIRNVNHIHTESFTVNDKIALQVSRMVGTMWFCYALAALMIIWALLQQAILPWLHLRPFDSYPFAFLFFCLGGIMQSLLMPMVMVQQNRQSRHTEIQSDAMYETDVKTHKDVETVIEQNNEIREQNNEIIQQNAEIIKQNDERDQAIQKQFEALALILTPAVTIRRRTRKQEVDET